MEQHAKKCKSITPKWDGDKRNAYPNEMMGECDCDSHHTFDELYDHRITLFIALCKSQSKGKGIGWWSDIWRSKLHHDGTKFEGWFIMGIAQNKGLQISYHLPLERWSETDFAQNLDKAPEWDGHTADDVIARLKTL